MHDKYRQLAIFLIDLEAALRNISCWEKTSPPFEALQSQEPFCVDAMELHQWLQWVFIPRMFTLLNAKEDLPARCQIAPMAEEWAKTRAISAREVIVILEAIDFVLSSS